MTYGRSQGLSLLVCLAVVATGCTSGPASSGPTSATSTPSSELPASAPSITRALDASAYRDRPCDLFTNDEAKALGYTAPGRPGGDPAVPQCSWPSSELVVRYYPDNDFFGQIYRREATWPAKLSIAITVAQQPAVRTDLPATEDYCRVAVGLTGTQTVEARVMSKTLDSCDQAVKVAEAVVRKLGG
jgi:hypothetical protein